MESTSPVNTKVIPIPVHGLHEGTYTYVAVKGSLHASESAIFGLSKEEEAAITKKFEMNPNKIVGGVLVKSSPIHMINVLGQLGYQVVCSTGETEVVWTMQREV